MVVGFTTTYAINAYNHSLHSRWVLLLKLTIILI